MKICGENWYRHQINIRWSSLVHNHSWCHSLQSQLLIVHQQLHGCQYYGNICQVVQAQNQHPKAGSFPKFVKEQSVAADRYSTRRVERVSRDIYQTCCSTSLPMFFILEKPACRGTTTCGLWWYCHQLILQQRSTKSWLWILIYNKLYKIQTYIYMCMPVYEKYSLIHFTWPKPALTNALTNVAAKFCLAESTLAPTLARPSSKCG